jgi:hypothetical protein
VTPSPPPSLSSHLLLTPLISPLPIPPPDMRDDVPSLCSGLPRHAASYLHIILYRSASFTQPHASPSRPATAPV